MKRAFFIAAAITAFTTTAFAQTMKPGLWEVNNKMSAGAGSEMDQKMAQAREAMKSMPPEQRKMMEDAMAQRGVKMGEGGPGNISVKVCMTKEMVERDQMPTQRSGDCTTTRQSRSGNTMNMAFTCTNPPSSGEGTFTFNSSEAYSMKMLMNTAVEGKPTKMTMEGTGKWLGADCGSVKPMVMPKK
ncbi:DUF3617 family protein [Caenimonas koreensis DSM 17982]|uniref:DUF3617 family protein n=1 Tax=Caenimonas koreensis DSM 17982 TaxID=1121255 RepID=A0A844BDA4_9BURK|nr:DUF3617 domain-containing protein [Caenimonas koreensis]MRD49437.1 DUF3617 family protein [Caenimonas koreensis DSM 17982]